MNPPDPPNPGSGGLGGRNWVRNSIGGKSIGRLSGKSVGRGTARTNPPGLDGENPDTLIPQQTRPVIEIADVFMTSENPSGKGNLFSPAPRNVGSNQSTSVPKPRSTGGKFPSFASSLKAYSNGKNSTDMQEPADIDEVPQNNDDEDDEDWAPESARDRQQNESHLDQVGDSEDDYEDVDEDEEEFRNTLTFSTPTDKKKRVGPYHQSVPQAMNVMHKYRNKDVAGQDPNGRKIGRNLVMWHRPRMMDKLVLHIQYECHLAKIRLPWDKIAHRLHPGASGPAIVQFLNKNRDVLVQEGHMIPPNMGKSKAVYDDTIRGYVRDEAQEIPTVVRILGWDEHYEDKKESLVVPGLIKGSGRYERNKENRVEVPKETGRRSRVPPQTKDKMAVNRSLRKRKNGGADKDGDAKTVAGAKKDAVAKKERSKKRTESPDSPTVKEEVDPAELNSDDDYNPSATVSNKRKAKSFQTSRKKARGAVEVPTVEIEDDATPTKPIKKPTSVAKSAIKSDKSKSMANLSIETPTKRAAVQQLEHSAISVIQKNAGASKLKSVSDTVYEDNDNTVSPEAVGHAADGEEYQGGRFNRASSLQGQTTPPFGASPLDINSQVRAGQTPPYNSQYYAQQRSSTYGAGENLFANFQHVSYDQHHPSASTTHQLGNSYGSATNNFYGTSYRGEQPRSTALPTAESPAPGSYADRQRRSAYMNSASAMFGAAYTNQGAYAFHQPLNMGASYGSGRGFINPSSLMYNSYQPSTYANLNPYNMASTNSSNSSQRIAGSYGLGDPSMDQENLALDTNEIVRNDDDQTE